MLDSSEGWNWSEVYMRYWLKMYSLAMRVSKDLNLDLVNQDLENFKDVWPNMEASFRMNLIFRGIER